MTKRIMVITGEVSGDLYGSLLVDEIRKKAPDIEISGVGGDRMRHAGVETFLDSNDLSVVGFWEAITRIGKLRKALAHAKAQIESLKPDLLILIDYPGMNLRLAQFAKARGVKVMYYVSPQIWAWGHNRVRLIRKNVDKMVVILPFEVEIYRKESIDATYVGHPLIDIVHTDLERDTFLNAVGLPRNGNLVALLPGSRVQEIKQHIRPLLETASILRRNLPTVQFVIVTLPALRGLVEHEMGMAGEAIAVTTDNRYAAVLYSDLAIASSGTATLEAALLGTPAIVIYKLALFSWVVGKVIVRVPFVSLTNLVAGEEVVPEYIQGAVNPKVLAAEAASLLTDDARRERIVGQLEKVKQSLGPGGATTRAADLALTLMAQ
jgi:lipid-A-disaccharide synthase